MKNISIKVKCGVINTHKNNRKLTKYLHDINSIYVTCTKGIVNASHLNTQHDCYNNNIQISVFICEVFLKNSHIKVSDLIMKQYILVLFERLDIMNQNSFIRTSKAINIMQH